MKIDYTKKMTPGYASVLTTMWDLLDMDELMRHYTKRDLLMLADAMKEQLDCMCNVVHNYENMISTTKEEHLDYMPQYEYLRRKDNT